MDKNAKDPKERQEAEEPTKQSESSAQKPVAVRSAKDAINAMYADKENSSLGDYLAMSARDIVNATDHKKGSAAKSAANLHKHASEQLPKNQRMESVRTSASALMKMAAAREKTSSTKPQVTDPIVARSKSQERPRSIAGPEAVASKAPTVVRTSLKLKPKKPTLRAPAGTGRRVSSGVHAPKQAIPLSRVHTPNPRVFQDVVSPGASSNRSNKSTPKPAVPTTGKIAMGATEGTKRITEVTNIHQKEGQSSIVSQNVSKVKGEDGIVSVARSQGAKSANTVLDNSAIRLKRTLQNTQNDIEKPVLKLGTAKTHSSKANPLDSIKKKFTPAPKGFAASNSREARPDRPYQVEDYLNPSHVTKSVPATDDATHYYGLSEEELADNAKGVQVNRDQMAAEAGLGVIEDYNSGEDDGKHQEATILRRDTPDNNKYALNAQSPYYLKPEKEMKKRPLSGNGAPRIDAEVATSVQASQDLEEELPKKNQYKKNTKKAKGDKAGKANKSEKTEKSSKPGRVGKSKSVRDINEPTMIIPAHHRSNAPLVALLLLTVILGATVGALAYLFFFQ